MKSSGSEASPAGREEHIRKQFEDMLSAVAPGVPDAAARPVIDELVSKILAGMSPASDDSPVTERAVQPDSASATETGKGS